MTSRNKLGRLGLISISAALVVSACGGNTPTAAPTTAAATTPPVTSAPATEAPVTAAPATEAPATEAPATVDPTVDAADDLKIAAPYTLEPLEEQIAKLFVDAMKLSAGEMADLFQFGFRTATRNGQTEAWVIVMAFPDLPITSRQLLDQIVNASAAGQGDVEKLTIGGEPARVLKRNGQAMVIMLNGDELLMIVGTARNATVNVAKAIAEAN